MMNYGLKKHKSKFAAFLNALYKAILCIMRRFCKDDKKNAFIAGFLSALSLAIDEKERR